MSESMKSRPWLPYVVPMAIYMAFLAVQRDANLVWVYPLKTIAVAAVLWFFRKEYEELRSTMWCNSVRRGSPDRADSDRPQGLERAGSGLRRAEAASSAQAGDPRTAGNCLHFTEAQLQRRGDKLATGVQQLARSAAERESAATRCWTAACAVLRH
jgi:hypothetical protein